MYNLAVMTDPPRSHFWWERRFCRIDRFNGDSRQQQGAGHHNLTGTPAAKAVSLSYTSSVNEHQHFRTLDPGSEWGSEKGSVNGSAGSSLTGG